MKYMKLLTQIQTLAEAFSHNSFRYVCMYVCVFAHLHMVAYFMRIGINIIFKNSAK